MLAGSYSGGVVLTFSVFSGGGGGISTANWEKAKKICSVSRCFEIKASFFYFELKI